MLKNMFVTYPLLSTLCRALILLAAGILAIRIADKILMDFIDKTAIS